MRNSRTMTILVLIAIPVALFSQIRMNSDFVRTITNASAMCLVFFAWGLFKSKPLSLIDTLLVRTYLIGLLVFSIWLGLNLIVRDTYESSWHNGRDAFLRHFCLKVEPFLVYPDAVLAIFFAILCVVRIFIAISDHYRPTGSPKASNV